MWVKKIKMDGDYTNVAFEVEIDAKYRLAIALWFSQQVVLMPNSYHQ